MTEKKKTSLYIDPALLRAVKVRAAREDKADYQVVEEALRAHLGADVIARVRARAGLPEEEAERLAVAETRAVRREMHRERRRRS